jgi:hypothetical protein
VRQHAPLRRARCAGRIDDQRRIVGGYGRSAALELLAVSARGGDRLKCDNTVGGVAALHDEGRPQRRHRITHGGDLGELRCVLNDNSDRAGVPDDPRTLVGRARGIDRDHDGADAPDCIGRDRPLGPRVGKDAHAVAGIDTVRQEAGRKALDVLADVGVGPVLPRAIALGAHSSEVAVVLRREAGQSCSRLGCCVDLRHGRSLLRCDAQPAVLPPGWSWAWVLAEFRDVSNRHADAKSRKNDASASPRHPVTRISGKHRVEVDPAGAGGRLRAGARTRPSCTRRGSADGRSRSWRPPGRRATSAVRAARCGGHLCGSRVGDVASSDRTRRGRGTPPDRGLTRR